jgi:hypothetical protein
MKNSILILAAAAVSLHGQIPADIKLAADVPFGYYQNARMMPVRHFVSFDECDATDSRDLR